MNARYRLTACLVGIFLLCVDHAAAQSASDAYEQGQSYLAQGAVGKACSSFSLAIQRDPKSSRSYAARGECNLRLQRYDVAIEDFGRAVGLDGRRVDAYLGRAQALEAKGDFKAAISDYSRVLDADAKNVFALYSRSWCHLRAGDCQRAKADSDDVIRVRPDSAAAHKIRGIAKLDLGDYDGGREDLIRAIQLDDDLDARDFFALDGRRSVSPEAMDHGRREMGKMLKDRPAMAQYAVTDSPMYVWATQRFAGQDLGALIDWSPKPLSATGDASHVGPGRKTRATINIRKERPARDESGIALGFEESWVSLIFEQYNITNSREVNALSSLASKGDITDRQFVERVCLLEFAAARKTYGFYLNVFLPWAGKQRVRTHPDLWYVWLPTTGKAHVAAQQDRDKYPWTPYAEHYDALRQRSLMKTGKPEAAVAYLVDVTRQDNCSRSRASRAYALIAKCWAQMGEHGKEREALESAIARKGLSNIEEAQTRCDVARLVELTDPDKALDIYRLVVTKFPGALCIPRALYAIGSIQLRQGKRADSERTFREVRERFPNSEEAAKLRGAPK